LKPLCGIFISDFNNGVVVCLAASQLPFPLFLFFEKEKEEVPSLQAVSQARQHQFKGAGQKLMILAERERKLVFLFSPFSLVQ